MGLKHPGVHDERALAVALLDLLERDGTIGCDGADRFAGMQGDINEGVVDGDGGRVGDCRRGGEEVEVVGPCALAVGGNQPLHADTGLHIADPAFQRRMDGDPGCLPGGERHGIPARHAVRVAFDDGAAV